MSLRHPNIVTFIGHCNKGSNFYLITEYLEKKSLKCVLENKKIDLNLKDKLNICLDISLGINYLHSDASCSLIIDNIDFSPYNNFNLSISYFKLIKIVSNLS